MAREKTFARKLASINPDNEDRLNGGDAHGLVRLARMDAPGGPGLNAIALGAASYSQNFDGLVSALPTDWFFSEAGTNADTAYTANNGSLSTGNTYSYGDAAAADRAFGSLRSGSLISTIGASFTNGTGGVINSLLIAYVGEQWRLGATGRNDRLDFEISFNATSLTSGTWVAVDGLDFIAPVSTGVAGALNGNANSVSVSFNITQLTIASGATFWIRWLDFDAAGSDDGLAIDNFTLVTPGALAIDDVALNEGNAGSTAFTFTVTRSGGSSGAVAATWTIGFPGGAGSASSGDLAAGQGLTGTVSFANGEVSKTITVNVNGDYLPENTETFNVTLSAPTGGATISDATGVGTITNDDVPGAISIDDVSHMEGDGGATLYTFTVSRTGQAAFTNVQWAINAQGGAGHAGLTDFPASQALSGTISFNPGETSRTITVSVLGDHLYEPDESFTVTLSNPSAGATIADGTGIGAILTDDAAPPFTPDGNEVTVNQNTDQDQVGPRVAWIDAGHYVVTWTSHETPTSYEVMARLFNADGTPAGNAFQVNTASAGDQVGNRVAALSGGGFVIVWSDVTTTDIRAQMFNADGSRDGNELLLNTDPNAQSVPWVSALPGGGFAAVWMHNDGVSYDIRGRTFDADGQPASAEFAVNANTALNQQYAQVTTLANGHFVVVWHDASGVGGDASGTAIKMRVFDTDGTALTGETLVNTTISGLQQFPAVGALAGGGYVVAWEDNSVSSDDVSGNALRAQIYDASGNAVGSEFLVNFTTAGSQARPTIAGLPDGGFVIGWWNQAEAVSVNEIRAQAFDALGNRRGGEFEVNSDAAGDQIGPSFAASPVNGHLVATWNDFNDSQDLTDGEIEQRLFSPPNPGALSIADLSQAEGNSGTTAFTFIVTRTGGSTGAVGASWTLDLSGTATSADFTIVPQSGLVSFADGQTSATIVVQVQGNAIFEPDETFAVTLSAPTGGATIGDGSGAGVIVNDDNPPPPTIDLNGPEGGTMSNAFYTENGAAVPIAFDPQIATADPGGIAQVDVRIRAGYVWTGDLLSIAGALPGGITAEILSDVHLILHTNGASLDDIEAALEQIRYRSTNPDANGGPMPHPQRVVDVTVADAHGGTATTLCQVVVGNAPPSVDLNGPASGVDYAAAYTENGAAVALGSGIVITAPQPIQGIEIAITGAVTGDLLFVDGILPGGITAFGGESGAPLYLTGSGSAADWQAALATVRYRSLIDNPDAYGNLPTRTITVTVGDTEKTGTATTTVTITAINDAPVVTATAGTTAYAESVNSSPGTIAVNNALTVTDADDTVLAGATVSITANFQAGQDILAFNNNNAASFGNIAASYDGGTGVLTLASAGGTATVAQWQAALRAVTYSNSAQEPSQAIRTISFVVNDGDADSVAATRLLSVTAQNDSPSGANATLSIGEDSIFTFNESHFGFSDVDGDVFAGIRFGAAPVGGTLYFDADAGGSGAPVAITSFPTGTYSAADIAAGKLTFVPTTNLNGTAAASVSFTVLDNGGTVGAGQNADLSPNTLTFDVTAVNDAATFGGQASGTVTEDGTTAASGMLTVDDIDGAGEEHFEAQLDAATAYGIFSIDQNGGWSYQLNNSHPDVQALDAADPPLTDTILVRSLDGTLTQVVITINGADEPPVGAPSVDLDGGAGGIDYDGSFAEGSATGIGEAIQVVQGTFPITSATITLTDGRAGDSLSIVGALPPGITNISGNDQQIQLVGINMSAASWAAALGQIAFTSSSDNPDNYGADTARSINVEVSDGFTISATATATIAIQAVNDAPTVGALDGDSVTWTEGNAYVLLDRAMPVTIVDPDNQNFGGGFVSFGVQVNPRAEDEFFILDIIPSVGTNGNEVYVYGAHIGTITSSGAGQILTISFNANATAARVATLIDHIGYRNNAGDVPTAGARSVSYVLNDGQGGAAGGVITLDVVAVNDGPTVADTNIAIVEDQVWVLSLADFDIVDPEGDAVATIMISGATGGLIYYDADGEGAGEPVAITLYPHTFSFGDIAAGRLSWVPETGVSGNDSSYFQYGVTDDRGAESAGARVYFDIALVIDAPTVDLNGPDQDDTYFDAAYGEGGAGAAIADSDLAITSESGSLTGATITIADAAAGDLLSVAGTLPGPITAFYDPDTATLTLSGLATIEQYQAALAQIRYSSTSEGPDAAGTATQRTIEIVVTDGFADGAPSSAPVYAYVAVTGEIDNPAIGNLDGDLATFSEGNAFALLDAGGDATVADLDNANFSGGTLTVSFNGTGLSQDRFDVASNDSVSLTPGSVIVGGVTIGSWDGGFPGGDFSVSLNGNATAERVQTLLRALAYRNSAGDTPTAGLRDVLITLTDGDGGTVSTASRVEVAAVNDAPTLGVNAGLTLAEGATATITAAMLDFNDVEQADGAIAYTLTSAPTNGVLLLNGIALSVGGGFTQAQVNGGLVSFQHDGGETSNASFAFSVSDGAGGLVAGQSFAVAVTPVNDAPVVTTTAGTTAYAESVNAAPGTIAVNDGLTLTDPDDGGLVGAMVSITGNYQLGQDILAFTNDNAATFGNISAFFNVGTGVLTLTSPGASATMAQWQAALRAVAYSNSSEEPSQATRTISFIAYDGEAYSAPATRLLSVAAQNDSPSGADATRTINEDSTFTFTAAHFGFSDVDGDALLGVRFGAAPVGGTLYFDADGAGGNAPVAIASFPTATYSAADIAAGKLTFVPTANLNGTGAASVGFTVVDNGGTAGAGQNADLTPNTLTFNITSVNDQPSGANSIITMAEDGAYVLKVADFGFSDVDGNAFEAVIFSNVTGGTLTINGNPYTNVTLVYLHTIQSGNVVFVPAANATGPTGSITFTVRDDGGFDNGGQAADTTPNTLTFSMTPVNDAPVNSVPGAQSINEDASLTLSTANGNALSVADVDATTLTVTLSVAHGTLTLASTAGLSFSGGSDGAADASMTFSGTAAAINAALGAGLTYNPNANFNGSDAISVVTTDGGQTGTGPVGTDGDSIAVNVTSVNDAPAAFAIPKTIAEDTTYTFAASDFGFFDPDGNNFLAVIISTTPANGQLLLNGIPVVAGTVVDVTEIAAGHLVFQPAPNATGIPYAGFNFQVRDDGGIANGGVNTDPVPDSFLINVTPVNDAPVNTVPGAQTINEDASFTLSTGNGNAISVADVDATTLTVTLSVAHGTLTIASTLGLTFSGGSDGTADASMTFSGTAAAINAALGAGLTYNPNANFNGSDAISVVTTDGGQTGTGPVGTDSDSIAVSITAINDAPSGTNATLTLNEDGTRTLSQADFGFSDPAEGHGFAGVVITTLPARGTLLLNGAALLVAETFVSAAELAAGQLVFRPDANANGAAYATLTFQVRDDGGTANGLDTDQSPNTLTFNVAAINDSPVVDLNGAGSGTSAILNYSEDGAAAAIAPGGAIIDIDTTDFGGGTLWVTITNGLNAEDMLSVLNQGNGAGQVGYANGLISYEGVTIADLLPTLGFPVPVLDIRFRSNLTVSPAAVEAVLRAVAYHNLSQDPATTPRTVTFSFNDGDGNPAGGDPSGNATATINLIAVDDAPVARGDAFAIEETALLSGNVFLDHGSGADGDVDGPGLAVAAVNGVGASVGQQIQLASGALLRLNADGSFSYDTNHAFDATPTASSGASNTPARDSFTYTLAGGGTATVSIVLAGLDTNDTLLGTAGADILAGGNGNDVYFVENGGDRVIEAAGAGFDVIYTSVSYTLAAGVEVEWLSTSIAYGAEGIHLTGNELANYVLGNEAANTLNGGGGADALVGYGGNDSYYVDNAGDSVFESAGGGFDAVYASTSYTLAAGVEVEWLSTSGAYGIEGIHLTGNEFANYVLGNDAANTLNGGGGADALVGYGGNDSYYVDNAGDAVFESAGGGFDAVYASTSYTLAAGVEVEWLSTSIAYGAEGIHLTGNELSNYVLGNEAANTLNGGGGADVLVGYGGNDSYYVDNARDAILENAGGGFDAVYTNTSYALGAGAEVEWLSAAVTYGTGAINLAGNELGNYVLGNDGANAIDGRGGADILYGYGGADIFAFTTALGSGNVDALMDFAAGTDRIGLDDAIFTAIGGTLSPDAFVIGATAAGTEDRIVYNQATGQLFYDADGSGGGAAILFATLQGAPVLSAADFTMI